MSEQEMWIDAEANKDYGSERVTKAIKSSNIFNQKKRINKREFPRENAIIRGFIFIMIFFSWWAYLAF